MVGNIINNGMWELCCSMVDNILISLVTFCRLHMSAHSLI